MIQIVALQPCAFGRRFDAFICRNGAAGRCPLGKHFSEAAFIYIGEVAARNIEELRATSICMNIICNQARRSTAWRWMDGRFGHIVFHILSPRCLHVTTSDRE